MNILASKIAFKIYCRSSSKYFAVKDEVISITKGFRAGLEIEPRVEGLFSLFILLLIAEDNYDIGLIEDII